MIISGSDKVNTRYGHYTLALCIVAMILNLLFGQVSLPDHVRLIPVLAMGSSFLTAAWPSLFQSFGRQPVTLYDMVAPLDSVSIPMSEPYTDDETNEDVLTFLQSTRSNPPHSLQRLQMNGNSPLTVSTPILRQHGHTQSFKQPASPPTNPHELIHMGPSSTCSGGTYQSGTSISLCSQGRCPSELSSNVVTNFFSEIRPNRHFETTQRRRAIESLGQGPPNGGSGYEGVEEARDQPILINLGLRKVQSI